LNDLEMLEFVQHGIAMGNAKEEVKKAADGITNSHEKYLSLENKDGN
jgi:hydroxymethylpyrimidine pyrophosphatase-like HAD family hydrolase